MNLTYKTIVQFLVGVVLYFFSPIILAIKEPSNIYLKAYPTQLSAIEDNQLVWKDGARMPIKLENSSNKALYPISAHDLLNNDKFQYAIDHPDLYLQILLPYPRSPLQPAISNSSIASTPTTSTLSTPSVNQDPGRIRYLPFFQKMYGATEEEVKSHLVQIDWMPGIFKDTESIKILVTSVNNIDKIFIKLSDDMEKLVRSKPEYKKYLKNPGGTFSWRLIAGTTRQSSHSFGMTIDINTEFSNYWLWDYKKEHGIPLDTEINENDIPLKDVPKYTNQIPWEIVEIFEKHHFIWGGKWYHYDTMHFEYRPELF